MNDDITDDRPNRSIRKIKDKHICQYKKDNLKRKIDKKLKFIQMEKRRAFKRRKSLFEYDNPLNEETYIPAKVVSQLDTDLTDWEIVSSEIPLIIKKTLFTRLLSWIQPRKNVWAKNV